MIFNDFSFLNERFFLIILIFYFFLIFCIFGNPY